METNFDYLLEKKEYADFALQAVEAEKSIATAKRIMEVVADIKRNSEEIA